MKMTMVLLVAAVALLVSADAAAWMSKVDNRNSIVYLTDKFNASSFEGEFVEDVSKLADHCQSKFFCKVTHILDNNKTFSTWPEKEVLVENLKIFNRQERVNCTAILDKPSTDVTIQMKVVIRYLKHCMKQKIFNGTKESIR